jgi:glycosyltransferase involved in cell wall biosynthesis
MNALFISNDPSLFKADSPTRERMRAYASAIGTLHILSRAPTGAMPVQEGALFLQPLPDSKIRSLLALTSAARALILRERIDIVSAQDPFEYGWCALQAVRGTKAKLHIQVHTDFLSPWFVGSDVFRSMRIPVSHLNRFRVRIARTVLPHANGIRVVSERIRTSLIKEYGTNIPDPVVLPISIGIEVPDAVPLPPHPFGFAFMTSGRLEPEKRIQDIFMALGKIAQHYPSVGLVVVGEGSERKKLELLAKKLNLAERILFMGEQGKNAWGLMKSAHAFVQASAYEGYGRTLLEAALANIPIVTTDVGIVGEVLKGYEQVLATPPADTENLAAHMRSLITDHQLRRTLAMNAAQAAKEHLSRYTNLPERIAEDLENTLT